MILTGKLRLQWIKMHSFSRPVVRIHKSLWQQVAYRRGLKLENAKEGGACLLKSFLKWVGNQQSSGLSTRYPHDIFETQIWSDFYQFWQSWENGCICRVPLGITSLSYLYIKLPHATEKGIRLLPYGLFVVPACFTYFDSDKDRTWL